MDVRFSPEQVALRDVGGSGRGSPRAAHAVGRSRRCRTGGDARRRGHRGGWRALRCRVRTVDRWPRGSRWRSWPRSWAGAWPTSRSWAPPWPPSCGGWPVRPEGDGHRDAWRSSAGGSVLARPLDGEWPPGSVVLDVRGRPAPSCSCPPAPAARLARWCSSGVEPGVRPRPDPQPACGPARGGCGRWSARPGALEADELTPVARASVCDWRAPTWSGPCAGRSRWPPSTPTTAASTGHPSGSFQAVQHLLADAFALLEGSRSIALHAAWAVDALPAGGRPRGGAGGQGLLRPGRPARCARRRSRCTAASATPGTAWRTCSSAGPCSRARCCGEDRRQSWTVCWRTGARRWGGVAGFR